MAWNESFSGEAGGWGGDSSFATSAPKDTATNKTAEKLPVPVTISDLVECSSSEEKYVLGDYPFRTVLVMGIVKSLKEDATTGVVYTVSDPEDETKEYRVVSYHGLNDGGPAPEKHVEGTRIMALGKLHSFNDVHGLTAFDVLEVCNDKEYHAFTLEAKIAKIYFSKNVPNQLQSRSADSLTGCAAGAPAPSAPAPGASQSTSAFGSQGPRLYNQGGGNADAAKTQGGIQGQKKKISDVLNDKADQWGPQGISVARIMQEAGLTDRVSVQADLDFLLSEGHIYNTDDDCYVTVTVDI